MTSVLQQLRAETAHEHHTLEQTAPFSTLMSGNFSQASYTRQLLVLRAFHGAIYNVTRAAPGHPVIAMLNASEVCLALDTDLQALTSDPVPAFATAYPLSNEVNDILACGYVWLGSSMGARMIHRWLSEHAPASLSKHYYQRLSACSQNWAAYRRYVDALSLSPEDHARICRCAKALFSGIKATAMTVTSTAKSA